MEKIVSRRHPKIGSHISRLSAPIWNTEPYCPAFLECFGGPVPEIEHWPIALRVVGMHVLAMSTLGKGYGDEGCMKRVEYQEDLVKDAYGDPQKRVDLHPGFASIDPHDGDAYLVTVAAQVRCKDLSNDPLWPHVWKKVWDKLFEIQDEARQEAIDSVKASRKEKAQERLLRKLRHKQAAQMDADVTYVQDYANRVLIHDQREEREREEAKAMEDARRRRVAEDRARRSNAHSVSHVLPSKVNTKKKKTVVALCAVDASKRETDKEEALVRLRAIASERRKKMTEMAAEEAERQKKINIGYSIQYGD